MNNLSGKTALVSGASSGIGLSIANHLLDHQCRVIGIARDFSKSGLNDPLFESHSVELGDLPATERLMKSLLKDTSVDFFIHSAGSGRFGSIEQFSVGHIDDYLKSDLGSALVLSRALIPAMRQRKSGRLVFIGSESALNAGKKGALYSTVKFGLRGLTQALREDCARDGITVSLVNPGMVRTSFFNGLSFRPASGPDNAIEADDVARLVVQILYSSRNMVIDEINLSPRNKSIDFS